MLAAFDLDGTLVDQAAAAREWTEEFVSHWGLHAGAIDEIASRLSERRPKGPLFEDLARQFSLPVSGELVAAAYRQRMPQLVRCNEDDKVALIRLRRAGWTVGIITNGTIENQEGKIRATGLAELVDGWVISEAVGIRKPDPAIFHALADLLACDVEGWMVGDSMEHDIAGATAVGLRTVLIAAGDPPASEFGPTLRAQTVAEGVRAILATSGAR